MTGGAYPGEDDVGHGGGGDADSADNQSDDDTWGYHEKLLPRLAWLANRWLRALIHAR